MSPVHSLEPSAWNVADGPSRGVLGFFAAGHLVAAGLNDRNASGGDDQTQEALRRLEKGASSSGLIRGWPSADLSRGSSGPAVSSGASSDPAIHRSGILSQDHRWKQCGNYPEGKDRKMAYRRTGLPPSA